jgi:hypothetical protein
MNIAFEKFGNASGITVLFSFMSVHYRTLKSSSGQQVLRLVIAKANIHPVLND